MAQKGYPCTLKQGGKYPGCNQVFNTAQQESNHKSACCINGLWIIHEAKKKAAKERKEREPVSLVCLWSDNMNSLVIECKKTNAWYIQPSIPLFSLSDTIQKQLSTLYKWEKEVEDKSEEKWFMISRDDLIQLLQAGREHR